MNLHLHSVLLMALDVVKGPYLKCFAPTNPFDSTLEGGVSQPINAEFRNDSEGDNVSGTHCQPGGGKKLGFGFNAPPAVDRINTFSEVFVPRSEFCRRVMYLLEAESGLLYLFYPEEICGQRYQRKTLRYTLCFVFCVDETLASMSTTLTEQILRPYSMVLTRIMEELREAELLYGYVSRGLPRSVEKAPKVQTTISHENSRVEGAAQCMGCDSADCGGGCLSASLPNARVSVSSGSPNEEVLHKAAKGGFCLNVFLTPSLGSSTQEFVPLEELTESVYACLRDDEVGCGERGWSLAPVRERTVSIKLSSTLSFHAGRRAPPCVPQHYELDEVPVPIAEYVEEALESADLTICGVFKEVDGEKTINQIIHALASGHGSQDALLQRWAVPSALLSSQRGSSSGKTRSAFVVGSHSSGNVLEHNTACVPSSGRFSSPHARSTSGVFCHSSCTLESRITSPTASAARPIAHFSVANDGSSNQTIQNIIASGQAVE
ncbi:hypothetical protein ERJ75_000142700 [Trypanosoma vivax]|nr:hypothetical protein ERJ75_000142700 [Trypanosoma vivax]